MIKANINTKDGLKVVEIEEVIVKMTEKQREKMLNDFNKKTKVLEWVGGVTYFIQGDGIRIKSSSLDELQQMFTAAYNNLPIPERKCFFNK